LGKKTKNARERLNRGSFRLPSPQEVRDAMTPAGSWTAATLAEWGVGWPPQKGWREDLRQRWLAQNPIDDQEEDHHWRFMRATPESGLVDRSSDAGFACLAVAVATQVTSAGFQKQLLIDLRETTCPDCGAVGYNTGMGFWLHACGSEWLSDGTPDVECGGPQQSGEST
jgi:hypothetical protein